MLRVRGNFHSRMAERSHGYVLDKNYIGTSHKALKMPRSVSIGPRTLCNACGLVYAKLVRSLSNCTASITRPFC